MAEGLAEKLLSNLYMLFSLRAETIATCFVLYLGYRLLRTAQRADQSSAGGLPTTMLPGFALLSVGLISIVVRETISLIFCALLAVLATGFGFAFLGYRLFQAGVFQSADLEVLWRNNRLLFKRAAPGSFFALFGSSLIVMALIGGPRLVTDYHAHSGKTTNEVIQLVQTLGHDLLQILRADILEESASSAALPLPPPPQPETAELDSLHTQKSPK